MVINSKMTTTFQNNKELIGRQQYIKKNHAELTKVKKKMFEIEYVEMR